MSLDAEPAASHTPTESSPPVLAGESSAANDSIATPPPLSQPNFLHPSSILFEAASHIRRFVVPAVVAVYSAASGGVWGLGIAVLVFGGALVTTIVHYLTLRYRIDGNDFVVTQGLLFRRVRSVPIRRIQNVDLVQNVFHRIFGVAEVNIETASGTEPEAKLRVLTRAQIDELRHAIFGAEQVASEASLTAPNSASAPAPLAAAAGQDVSQSAEPESAGFSSRKLIHQIPLRDLVTAGLASNRGMVLLSVLLGLAFQGNYSWSPTGGNWWRNREWKNSWWGGDIEQLAGYLPSVDQPVGFVIAVCLGLLVLFISLRVFGIAWYVLRFYGHQLTRQNNDMRITCGLFTKVSATVPRQRIQYISVHRSWLMRWFKLAAIRIETAGGGGKDNENAAATVSRRWFLPVVAEQDVPRILAELRPGMDWAESQVQWHAVSPLTGRRLMRLALISSTLIAVAGCWFWPPWGLGGGLLAFPLLAYVATKKSRAMRYARTDWGVAYRSGVFTRKLSFAFYDRIQAIELRQSPFDRRWRMASLAIDTAAAGPANHVIDVNYLDVDFATAQFADMQLDAARHRPSWG